MEELTEEVIKTFHERKTMSFAQLLVLFGPKIGTVIAKLEGMDLIVLDESNPGVWMITK